MVDGPFFSKYPCLLASEGPFIGSSTYSGCEDNTISLGASWPRGYARSCSSVFVEEKLTLNSEDPPVGEAFVFRYIGTWAEGKIYDATPWRS